MPIQQHMLSSLLCDEILIEPELLLDCSSPSEKEREDFRLSGRKITWWSDNESTDSGEEEPGVPDDAPPEDKDFRKQSPRDKLAAYTLTRTKGVRPVKRTPRSDYKCLDQEELDRRVSELRKTLKREAAVHPWGHAIGQERTSCDSP